MCFDGEEKKLNLFLPQVLIQRETARKQDRNCTETEEEKKLNLFLPQVLIQTETRCRFMMQIQLRTISTGLLTSFTS